MILIIIKFCELLLRISPSIINSLRSYIKHSKECFHLFPNTSKLVRKNSAPPRFSNLLLGVWKLHPYLYVFFFFWLFKVTPKIGDISLIKEKQKNEDTETAANDKLGPVHTYPDIFESANFSFRIRLPSTRIRRIRQRIRIFLNPPSKAEKNKFATNPITCGRWNPNIFESDDLQNRPQSLTAQ